MRSLLGHCSRGHSLGLPHDAVAQPFSGNQDPACAEFQALFLLSVDVYKRQMLRIAHCMFNLKN